MSRGPLLLALLMLGMPVQAIEPGPDPVPSVMWEFYRKQWIKDDPYLFDARVRVIAPPFAEDARQVPLQIDARDVPGKVTRIIAWAELNPLPTIVDFKPGPHVLPWLAIRIRIEQATALRAAVQTEDGVWHVGSTLIDAAGGGCTAPSVVRSQPDWEQRLGQVLGGRYPREGSVACACTLRTPWTMAWWRAHRSFSSSRLNCSTSPATRWRPWCCTRR